MRGGEAMTELAVPSLPEPLTYQMSTPLPKNAKLAYRVLDYVTANPELLDQWSWWGELGTACFAGWTLLLTEPEVWEPVRAVQSCWNRKLRVTVEERAAALLGLDELEAIRLFMHTTNDELPYRIKLLFGERPTDRIEGT